MIINPFITKPHHYSANHEEASKLRVIPGRITQPGGKQDPGVVILSSWRIKLAMNERQALDLANAIADAIDLNHAERTTAHE